MVMSELSPLLSALALHESATGLMILDADERVMLWNKRLEQTSFIGAEQALNKKFIEVFPTLLGSRIHASIRLCLKQGFPAFLSQPLNAKLFPLYMPSTSEQNKIPLQQQVQFIPLGNKASGRYCMIQIMDISALVSRERVIKAKEKEFRAMFELAASGHALVEPALGKFVRVNRKLCEMLGYNMDELLQQTLFAMTLTDDRPMIQTVFSQLIAGKIAEFSCNLRCLNKNGTIVWFYVSVTLAGEFKQNDSKLAILVLQDITELKTIENRLQVSQFALDNIRVAIFWINQQGKIKYANAEACRSSGYSVAQLQESSLFDLDKNYTSAQWQQDWLRLKKKGSFNFEYSFERGDNHAAYPVDITANYLQYGDLEFVCAFVHDISDRKKYELVLQKAKEAAEANNRAKSMFLSNMSHELRTPLNAILGFSQLMERDPELKSSHQHNLAIINNSGQHLLSLINDVLEISRIETGRLAVESEIFDLDMTLKELKNMINVRAESKGLSVVLEYENLPQRVKGDVHHLRQVMINLLGNAVKYTDAGKITLKVECDQNANTHFAVIDTGPGIPSAERERIFDAFYQTAVGVKKGEGTGLGLAISREYVYLMGGTLVVNDNPEGGSIFSFTIPLPASSLNATEVKSGNKIAFLKQGMTSPRVLVVEDDTNSRELLIAMLKDAGIDTRGAENGKIALDIYAQWRPQFIWMDMRMPVMDGYEATRRIRAFRDNNVFIVALTASAFTEDRKMILEAGCDEILTKPFQTEKIFELMQHFLPIEFDYDQATVTVAEEFYQHIDLSELSHAQLQQLHDYAIELEYEDVQYFIESIQSQHSDTARELKQLLDNFRFDQIIALCEFQLDASTP